MLPFEEWSKKAKVMAIPENWIVHEFFQRLILFALYSDLDIPWVFHGGTALRFFYGSPRFSLDLDFTGILQNGKYDKLVNNIKSHIESYTALIGVSTKVTSIKYYSEPPKMLRFFIVFSSEAISRQIRIKLEILNISFKRYTIKELLIDIPIRSITRPFKK